MKQAIVRVIRPRALFIAFLTSLSYVIYPEKHLEKIYYISFRFANDAATADNLST